MEMASSQDNNFGSKGECRSRAPHCRFSHPSQKSQKDIANICNPHGDLQWMAEKSLFFSWETICYNVALPIVCQKVVRIQLASSMGWTTRIDLKPSEQTP